jgi:colanic acid/amylovoran biosynthesis glycosyltransferase
MRIAFFVDRFPVVSETFIQRQITGLLDLGHTVDIYAEHRPQAKSPLHPEFQIYDLAARTVYMEPLMPSDSGYWEMPVWPITGQTWLPGQELPISNALRIVRALPIILKCLAVKPRLTFRVLDPSEYGYQARSLSTLYRLSALISQRSHYDVIHAHFGPTGNAFRFTHELWQAPMLVTFHGFDFSSLPREQGRGIYKNLFATVDLVTVNSEYTYGRVAELGCPATKLRCLHMGLDVTRLLFSERYRHGTEPTRLVTVARLVEIKGLEYAIRAVGDVKNRLPNLRYDIIGEGPQRPRLETLIHRLGLENTVILHGAQAGDAVQRMMAAAHLFMLTSVSVDGDQEGQGLALQEAQAAGLPVVATDHGAFPEGILPGESGFLVPERDVAALAERLLYLIEHPEIWPAMGRRGREHVERNYDLRLLNSRLVDLYREALSMYGPARPSRPSLSSGREP